MKFWIGGALGVALLGGALAVGAASQPGGTLAPGLRVGGVDVSGMTRAQALAAVAERAPAAPQVSVTAGTNSWTVAADQLGWHTDAGASVKPAEQASADRGLIERLQALLGQAKVQDFPLLTTVNADLARAGLTTLAGGLEVQPRNASVIFDKATKRYAVKSDKAGQRPDVAAAVKAYVAAPGSTAVSIPLRVWPAERPAAQVQPLVDQGNALVRPFKVQLAGTTRTGILSALQVANLYWVRPTGIEADESAMKAAFGQLTGYIDQPAQDARYALKGTALVKVPEKAGTVTDRPAAYAAFRVAVLDAAKVQLVLPSKPDAPTLTLAQLPDPGKLELITVGKSTYYHSSAARRTNVANAAAKINGAVVPAGEVFSFLNTLGGISAGNGFVSGLIISGGRTVDGLGGGVCQVSTTTFRALYQAGLPVVERNQHSYRVGYYEPQVGFEAAVYDPGVDLKFMNDTGAPLLIKTVNDNANSILKVEVWGVKPARTVAVSPAVILARTAHPPAQYIVNPKLRPGVVSQVDWAADGFNLYITRTIKDDAGVRTDVTKTIYKPWRAVYEIGPKG
ncbi:VanW family protein [Deinococcus sp.]|uniref:VanW family protein n=1 Tax=Deinococcus sp. TaxID=47478 RepID=UPI0028698780|nr:VanW family protein [Deinococcus sp.]